jgi:hypothetical protein
MSDFTGEEKRQYQLKADAEKALRTEMVSRWNVEAGAFVSCKKHPDDKREAKYNGQIICASCLDEWSNSPESTLEQMYPHHFGTEPGLQFVGDSLLINDHNKAELTRLAKQPGYIASLTPEERAMFLELMELVIGTPNPFEAQTGEKQ